MAARGRLSRARRPYPVLSFTRAHLCPPLIQRVRVTVTTGAACDLLSGACADGIRFAWSCQTAAGASCTGVAIPPTSACEWVIGSRTLPAGTYGFSVAVWKPSSGETASVSVTITIESGALPAVSIGVLAARKQNPTQRLALRGQAFLPAGAALGDRPAPSGRSRRPGSNLGHFIDRHHEAESRAADVLPQRNVRSRCGRATMAAWLRQRERT